MNIEMEAVDGNPILRRPPGHSRVSAIVSGDSELDEEDEEEEGYAHEDIFSGAGGYSSALRRDAVIGESTDQEVGEGAGEEERLYRLNPKDPAHADDLYDQNLDDEDEAYVYKHMRGGIRETVMMRRRALPQQAQNEHGEIPTDPHSNDDAPLLGESKPVQVYKPRETDAVLSCPSCFNIVCMDCQRHQKYFHQFRAMFVMGITVDWYSRLIYDDEQEALVPKGAPPNLSKQVVPLDSPAGNEFQSSEIRYPSYEEGEYFPVHCARCQTQVAALDMTEEVYHFYGCLESS